MAPARAMYTQSSPGPRQVVPTIIQSGLLTDSIAQVKLSHTVVLVVENSSQGTFGLAVIALAVSPGPDLALLLGRGIGQSRQVAFHTALGMLLAGRIQACLGAGARLGRRVFLDGIQSAAYCRCRLPGMA